MIFHFFSLSSFHFYYLLLLILSSFMTLITTTNTNPILYEKVTSYQVLQRNRHNNQVQVKSNNGTILTLKVGGPYTIDESTTNVYVGDVWVLAGQSNMRGYGFFEKEITSLDPKPMHVFYSNESSWGPVRSDQPVHQIATSPRQVHHTLPDPTVRDPNLSLVRGYSLVPAFNHYYRDHLKNVPVGFIPCSHGGVELSQWAATVNQSDPQTSLYGAMMDKINLASGGKGHITGVLWYQGESDAVKIDLAKQYATAFKSWLIQLYTDLNMQFNNNVHQQPIYFIYTQIATTLANQINLDAELGWSLVRQAQLQVFDELVALNYPIALVSTINAELDDYIHLSGRGSQQVGKLMAQAAVQLIQSKNKKQVNIALYGTKVDMIHYPFNENKNYNHVLRITFNHDTLPSHFKWQSSINQQITGFTIHDTQTQYQLVDMIYSIKIYEQRYVDLYLTEKGYKLLADNNNTIVDRYVLYYGFGQHPYCNLISSSQIPSLAFGPLSIPITPLPI
ncbi:unnamed protein product [Cunninghamella echinulata]